MSLLTVENLSVSRQKRQILHDVSFTVQKGELVGLIGPNGAGKSTLMRAILGQLPSSGIININGHEAATITAQQRSRQLGYLPQQREISWDITVEAVVALARQQQLARFKQLDTADYQLIEQAMQHMQILHLRHHIATRLSGGEQARVHIARVLAQQAPILLADEPVTGLDPAHQIGLMQTLAQLATTGHGIITSLHDLGLAARWCTRLILLDQGRIIADDIPANVLTKATLNEIYGVNAYMAGSADGLIVQPVTLSRGL